MMKNFQRTTICVVCPNPNRHLISIFEELRCSYEYRVKYFFWNELPEYRKQLGWNKPANSILLSTRSLIAGRVLAELIKASHAFIHGIAAPFPKMPFLAALLVNLRRHTFISSEGFERKMPKGPLRIILKVLMNRKKVTYLGIGNGACEDYREAGLSKWKYRKFCFAEKYESHDYPIQHKDPTEPVRILCVGRLVRKKRFSDVLNALRGYEERAISITFAGEGPELGNLKKLASSLPENIRTHFLGFKIGSALAKLYEKADIFVLPSSYDGWGVVVNQAIHYHIPCIVSGNVRSGENNLIVHEKNGFIYRSQHELRTYLIALIENKELRESIRKENELFAMLWNIENVAQRLHLVIEDESIDFERGPLTGC